MTVKELLKSGTLEEKKSLFQFDKNDPINKVVFKYNLWARYFFSKYYTAKDAAFHKEMDMYLAKLYRGDIKTFTNIAFRGAAKTARTKLFVAYVIANDKDRSRRYFRVLSANLKNSKQIVTDIYNSLVAPRVTQMYPELFSKTNTKIKTEETQSSFTTNEKIKVIAGTVGMDQRGAALEESRPDFQWYEDFENRKTLHSAVTTNFLWMNMEEARTGEAVDGVGLYTCNYLSEAGNVHKLVEKKSEGNIVLIIPIIDKQGVLSWPEYYPQDKVDFMKENDDDFEGERLCEPSASADILFNRELLDDMKCRQPIETTAGFKIFYEFDPSDVYGSGHDVGGGVGLDSSTSVFFDFSTVPARVVGTFKSNTLKPEQFGNEIYRESSLYGNCIAGVEINFGDSALLQAKLLGQNLYMRQAKGTKVKDTVPTEYGWHTNTLTKPKMINALVLAVKKGFVDLSDEDLIKECKSYSRNDLMEKPIDPRLTTRHFDLLIAAAIAWQMKDYAQVLEVNDYEEEEEEEPLYNDIGV